MLALHRGAIQGKEGIKFCHLATLSADVSNGGGGVGKSEAGDAVKLETDPSESGEPFVTKFGPAITTADVPIGVQGCYLMQS